MPKRASHMRAGGAIRPCRSSQSRDDRQPSAIADDQAGERMRNLDMKMEASILGVFVGIAARRESDGQRYSKQAPAPHDQPQVGILAYQGHSGTERSEAFAHEPFEASAPL